MNSISTAFRIIIALGLCFSFTAASYSQNQSFNNESGGVTDIPEWLEVQVDRALPEKGLTSWIPGENFQASSLVRVPRFPGRSYQIGESSASSLSLQGVQNEQISAQIAIAADQNVTNASVTVSDFKASGNQTYKAENIRVRYVKFIPVQHSLTGAKIEDIHTEGVSGARNPDVIGDPLIDLNSVDVPKYRAQPIWFTFQIPPSTDPGMYHGTIEIHTDQFETIEYDVTLTVLETALPNPTDFKFNLDVWFNPYAISDYHEVEAWSEEHWSLLDPYLIDLAQFGQKKILTTIVEKPWKVSWLNDEFRGQTESEFESMVKWTLTEDGNWEFDYSIFDRFVEMSLDYDNGPTIVAYSMLVFRGDQRITYFDEEKNRQIEEYIDMMSNKYEEVWTTFLKDFEQHLREKDWFDQVHLGFDERPARFMNRAFSIIENAVPEFMDKIYISGGTINLEATDLNIEITHLDEEGVQEGINERTSRDLPTRFYQTCCSGAHPNRFTFSPATELQLIPWIALKYNLDGYVDWAYNSWPDDIFNYPVFNFTQGDEYYVYPGEDGPVSSIRWELIKEGIEDFELAKILINNGTLSTEKLQEAIDLGTRNAFNGQKDPGDFVKARQLLLQPKN